jgi:2-methylcitrate dehydratase PrpD
MSHGCRRAARVAVTVGEPMTAADADVSRHLADFAADVEYTDLPAEAVDAAKKSILDTLGVILAGGGAEPAVRAVVGLAMHGGGRPEASVLGFGGRIPAVMAAFANGAMAHCLDFDDQTPWGQHASSSIVPAVFAIAERQGGVSGRDVVAAVAVGQDIFARLRCHVRWRKDWNLSSVLGVYAATAAASRVLRLPGAAVHHALGVASQQSCGVMEVVGGTGGDLRGLYAGFSAKGAVLATLLAQEGVTAVPALFEGAYGVFATYFDGSYDRAAILQDLGLDFRGAGTLYKPWPAVGTSHSHLHATIEIMARNDLRVEDIDTVRIHVGDYHSLMCTPLDARRAPTTLVDAKFSLPYLVAVAAVRRGVTVADFTPEALRDPRVLAIARRVEPVQDRSLDWTLELPLGRVEIVTHDGRRFERIGTEPPGSSESPLTWFDLARKFEQCAAMAGAPPPAGRVEAVQQMVQNLDSLADATQIVRMLT